MNITNSLVPTSFLARVSIKSLIKITVQFSRIEDLLKEVLCLLLLLFYCHSYFYLIESQFVPQEGKKLMATLLPELPKWWDCRCEAPHLPCTMYFVQGARMRLALGANILWVNRCAIARVLSFLNLVIVLVIKIFSDKNKLKFV